MNPIFNTYLHPIFLHLVLPSTFHLSLQTCYRFKSPSFVDLSAHFWEFSLNASTTISSYAFRVYNDLATEDAGYLVSWTLYGSLGSANGTAPTSPSDPSWVLVDTQTNVDFSQLFTPGFPLRDDVFYYPLNTSVTFQYFGFVGSLTAPANATSPFIDPIKSVKFCT